MILITSCPKNIEPDIEKHTQKHERRLTSSSLRCLRRILGIFWYDSVSNKDVLERANTPSVLLLLFLRRLRWLGHVRRMEDGRLPKDVLYGHPLRQVPDRLAVQCYATRTCARGTWILPRSIPTFGKRLQLIAVTGVVSSGQMSRELRPWGSSCGTTEGKKREQEHPPYPSYQQPTYAETVTETATRELDSTVTVDALPIQWTNILQSVVFRGRRRN